MGTFYGLSIEQLHERLNAQTTREHALLARIEALEARIAILEAIAHPIMDGLLSDALKREQRTEPLR